MIKQTLEELKRNRERVLEGKVNCIANPFPRFSSVIPGLIKGNYYIFTAGSGVGKTQFTKHWLYHARTFCRDNNIKLKVLYFALEETRSEFARSLFCNHLYQKHQIKVDVNQLQSMSEAVDLKVINILEKEEKEFSDIAKDIEIIDTISNPTGIYKRVKEYALENGTFYYYNYKQDPLKNNVLSRDQFDLVRDKSDWAFSHYIPNDEEEYVIVVVDHFSLLSPEKDAETLHKAMSRMSADYGRMNITKNLNYIFINVQQQVSDGENAEFTKLGSKIEEKLKPTKAKLADNKLTQRDAHTILGIFNPYYHGINSYQKYNTKILQDEFRSVITLKNRYGPVGKETGLLFKGASNYFRELPPASEITSPMYERFRNE